MRNYELIFLARQDIAQNQVEAMIGTFAEILKANGGSIVHSEYCGLKALSYRIRKNRKAHYVLLDVLAPPAAKEELERLMRINEDVLRFLTVSVEAFGARPSALMQSRYSREDRPFNREDRSYGREDYSDRRSNDSAQGPREAAPTEGVSPSVVDEVLA